MKSKWDKVLLVVIVVVSLALVAFVKQYGRRDPTDNGVWYLGIFGLAFVAGLFSPGRPWRWGIATVVPHYAMIFYPEVSNLWPLAMGFMSVLIAPATLFAWLGSRLRGVIQGLTGAKSPEPPVLDDKGES